MRRSRSVTLLAAAVAGAAALATATTTASAAAPAATAASAAAGLPEGTGWFAGGDTEAINPTPAQIAVGTFYLGGFGLGDGQVAGQDSMTGSRAAVGVLGSGSQVHAMALGDGLRSIVTAQIDTQGYYIAYKAGDFGIVDIRRQAAADVAAIRAKDPKAGPPLTANQIVVDSDHTHGGPDTAGVWGGVPTDYLSLVKDQTVKAIVTAWKALRPVTLTYATAPLGVTGSAYDSRYPAGFDRLMNNQFGDDPANQDVDDELRVIRAKDATTGAPVVTYANMSMHADVLGASNLLNTGDYIGPLSDLLGSEGGVGFAQVATLGREQPNRGDCASPINTGPQAGVPQLACLNAYATRVYARVRQALANSETPVTGKKIVNLSSYFLTDAADNAVIIGLDDGGFAAGAPLLRANTPPWFTGNVVGSVSYSGRIGNLLISGNPGEPYPQLVHAVSGAVTGKQGYLSLGTAGDFLGYIIYPFSAYPEPIRRSILSGSTTGACSPAPTGTPVGCPAPIGNDNFFFNLSQTFGARLVCSELRGATDMFPEDGKDYEAAFLVDTTDITDPTLAASRSCATFASDAQLAPGYDTQFSSTSLMPAAPVGTDPTTPAAANPTLPEAASSAFLLLAGLGGGALVLARRRRRTSV